MNKYLIECTHIEDSNLDDLDITNFEKVVNSCALDTVARQLYSLDILVEIMKLQYLNSEINYETLYCDDFLDIKQQLKSTLVNIQSNKVHIIELPNESIVGLIASNFDGTMTTRIFCESESMYINYIKKIILHIISNKKIEIIFYGILKKQNQLSSYCQRGYFIEKALAFLNNQAYVMASFQYVFKSHLLVFSQLSLANTIQTHLRWSLSKIKSSNTGDTVYCLEVGNEKYIFRILNPESSIAERKVAIKNIINIALTGLTPPVISSSKNAQYYVVKYIEGNNAHSLDYSDPVFIDNLGKSLKLFHEANIKSSPLKNPNIDRLNYMDIIYKKNIPVPKIFTQLLKLFQALYYIFLSPNDTVPSHFDLHPENIIFTGNRIYLIDCEYAGLGSKYIDLVIVSMTSNMKPATENLFLHSYFNKEHIRVEQAKYALTKAIGLFLTACYEFLHAFYKLIPTVKLKTQAFQLPYYNNKELDSLYTESNNIIQYYDHKNCDPRDVQLTAISILKRFQSEIQSDLMEENIRIIRYDRMSHKNMSSLIVKNSGLWDRCNKKELRDLYFNFPKMIDKQIIKL